MYKKHYPVKKSVFLFFSMLSVLSLFAQTNIKNPVEISFMSNGDKIKGWFYRAEIPEPLASVILLQGYPGEEGDLFGLGQALSQKGCTVLAFSYSGTWHSSGLFTPQTSLKSSLSALDFIKSEKMIRTYHIDTSKICLIGYSYGGGMALLAAAQRPVVKGVVSIGGGDLSVVANMIEKSSVFRKIHQQFLDDCLADPTVSRGLSGKASHKWLLQNRANYDIKKRAEQLVPKSILLISGWRDHTIMLEDHILPLYRVLREKGALNLELKMYDCNHSYENVQTELRVKIIDWLESAF